MNSETSYFRHTTLAAVLVVAILAAVYSLNSVDRSFWSENEAFYALGARSVLDGNWLLPEVFPGKLADKPPLTFWLVASVSWFFGGVSEWTARLTNLLASLGVMGALFFWGRRMIHPVAALMAVLMLGTTYEFWETSLEVNTDTPLLALLTFAWGAMCVMMEGRRSRLLWLGLWGALGLGLLTKGPVAFVLSGLVAIVYAISRDGFKRFWPRLMSLKPFTGAVLALVPFALWLVAVWMTRGFEPVRVIIIEHNIERFVSAFDHERPWYYYFLQTPVSMLPWTVIWPFAIWAVIRARRSEGRIAPPQKFALCVMVTVFAFFSLSSSKRDYYLLPMLPWAALLSGDYLWRRICRVTADVAASEHSGIAGVIPLMRRSGAGVFFMTILGLMLISMTIYSGFATNLMDKRKTAKPMATSINDAVDRDDQLVLLDERDPRLLYYISEHYELFSDDEEDMPLLRAWLKDRVEVDLLVGEGDLELIIDFFQDLKWYIQDRPSFRDDSYYLLTTEPDAGGDPLIGLPVDKPSGLCYHAARGTLFAVGENGELAEMTLDGRVLQKSTIPADFEAVTVDDAGNLLAVDEDANDLLLISPDDLTLTTRYAIEVDEGVALKPRDGSDGLEGLCFLGSGDGSRLFAVNESDPPLLLEMVLKPGPSATEGRAIVVSSQPLEIEALGELTALESKDNPPRLIVLSKKSKELVEIDDKGRVLRRVPLPGEDQEAVTLGPGDVVFHSGENQMLMMMKLNGVN